MTSFIQSAGLVVLLSASTAVAQPAGAASKAPQPDRVALSSSGQPNDQLKQEGSAEEPAVAKTATDVSQQAKARARESLWHRWNDLP